MVLVDADIVCSQLKKNEIWRVLGQRRMIFLQEFQVFSRVVTTAAMIEDFCPYAFVFENLAQKSWITGFGDAVAGTKDDYAFRRCGAKGNGIS